MGVTMATKKYSVKGYNFYLNVFYKIGTRNVTGWVEKSCTALLIVLANTLLQTIIKTNCQTFVSKPNKWK